MTAPRWTDRAVLDLHAVPDPHGLADDHVETDARLRADRDRPAESCIG